MRVLVVEHERTIAGYLRSVLSRAGHDCVIALHGASGREQIVSATQPFDVAILDLTLSDVPAAEVLAELRARQPRCAVILSTAYGTKTTLRGDAVLTRPVSSKGLEEAMRAAAIARRARESGHGGRSAPGAVTPPK